MMTEKLQDALNRQIIAELWSANLYLSMSFYFRKQGFDGFAHWMKEQSREETEHACMFADYLIKRGGRNPTLTKVDEVPQSWDSPLDAFRHVYGHECEVSEMIDRLMQTAIEEKDNATQEFLWHFVREQVEEEATAESMQRRFGWSGTPAFFFSMQNWVNVKPATWLNE